MSSGVIPVVLNRGGVGDIVKHGHNGFLAPFAQVGSDAAANMRWSAEACRMLPTGLTAGGGAG